MKHVEVLSFFLGSLLTLFLWLNYSYFEEKVCRDAADLAFLNEEVHEEIERRLTSEIAEITRKLSFMSQKSLIHEEEYAGLPHEIINLRRELLSFENRILDRIGNKSRDFRTSKESNQGENSCCEMTLSTDKCAARFNHTFLGGSGMSGKVCGSFKFLLNWSMKNITTDTNRYKIIDVVKNCTHTHTELVFNETKGFYQVQDGYFRNLNDPHAECEYFPRHL